MTAPKLSPAFVLKWFRIGEAIPTGSRFVRSGQFLVNEYDDDVSFYLGSIKEYEERYLYEVPV